MSRVDSVTSSGPAKAQLRGETSSEGSPRRQPKWLTEVVASVLKDVRGTVKAIAIALNVQEGAVYKVADLHDPNALKAFWIPTITQETGSFAILDALEAQVGRVAFVLPSGAASDELHARVAATVKEFGEMLQTSGTALEDGHLSIAERDALVREIDESVRVLCEYRAAVITKASKDAAA
jgi:hypothetical protein